MKTKTKTKRVLKNKTQKNCVAGLNMKNRYHTTVSSQTLRILDRQWTRISKNMNNTDLGSEPLNPEQVDAIKRSNMYSVVPPEIRELFEKMDCVGAYLKTDLPKDRTAHIYIVEDDKPLTYEDKSSPTNASGKYATYLRFIVAWLRYVSSIASPTCSKELHIYLLLTDAKKVLPDSHSDPVDVLHANTAFTTACSSKNTIFIFRREEWFKVLLHETFHCMGLDFSHLLDSDVSNRRILSIFPAIEPGTDIRLYETFCEMWAEIFHLMFCLFTNKHGAIQSFSSKKYASALRREQLFSIYQSNKLLKRAGYKYRELFVKPDANPPYKENTQAFSYYVIKSILLWNVDAFVKWSNDGSPDLIQFAPERITEYCDLVERLAKSTDYGKIHTVTSKKHCLRKTMRMTAIDPVWV